MFGGAWSEKNNGLKPGDASKWIFLTFLKFSKSSFFHQKIFIFWTFLTPNGIKKLVSTLIFWRPEMHHLVSCDILDGLKILRAKVIKEISRNLQNTTKKSHIRAGPEEPQKALASYYVESEKFRLVKSYDVWGRPGVKKTMVWSPETRLNWYFWHFWNSQNLHFFIKKSSFFWTILTPNGI